MINMDKPTLWKSDIATSVDFYNQWFMKFAPVTYREQRVEVTKHVEDALQKSRTFHKSHRTSFERTRQFYLRFACAVARHWHANAWPAWPRSTKPWSRRWKRGQSRPGCNSRHSIPACRRWSPSLSGYLIPTFSLG